MPNLRTVRFDINPSKMEEYLTRYLYRNYALESIHLRIDKNAGDFFGTGGGSRLAHVYFVTSVTIIPCRFTNF